MRDVFEWVKKNVPTLFSFLGIILMVYFSVFYIPDYVSEMKMEKVNTVNNGLVETVQELVYNDQTVDIEDLKSLIKGKEIKHGIDYPYSIDELLIQTQESFLGNKFIPLKQRMKLVDSIDSIRSAIEPPHLEELAETRKASTSEWFPSVLFGFLGVFFGILGLITLALKAKREREAETEIRVGESAEEIENRIKSGLKYEHMVAGVLSMLNTVKSISRYTTPLGYDYEIETIKGKFFVECKFYTPQRQVPAHLVEGLGFLAAGSDTRAILVTNSQLSKSAQKRIQKHNLEHKEITIYVIRGENEEEVRKGFESLLGQSPDNT